MLSLKGTGVHKGIAVGKLVFYERQLFHVEKQTQEDTQTQVQRYRQAKEQAVMQVQTLHKLALREISSENAAIFQAHHLLLEDQDFNGYVLELIKNQHTGSRNLLQDVFLHPRPIFAAAGNRCPRCGASLDQQPDLWEGGAVCAGIPVHPGIR